MKQNTNPRTHIFSTKCERAWTRPGAERLPGLDRQVAPRGQREGVVLDHLPRGGGAGRATEGKCVPQTGSGNNTIDRPTPA